MTTILLVIQVLLALGIIGLVLIQRSDSDGFGMGSGSGFGVISGRAKANLLTRSTAILAGLFMLNSLLLTILTTGGSSSSLIDRLSDKPAAVEKTEAPEKDKAVDETAVTPAIPVEGTGLSADKAEETVSKDASSEEAPAESAPAPAAEEEPVTPVVPRAE